MKILINASNLHNGGGVQVATSFLHELIKSNSNILDHITVYASSEVHRNLINIEKNTTRLCNYQVLDVHGLQALNPKVARLFSGFDVVFTIFGPLYTINIIKNHILGFAQAWILQPKNEISKNFSLFEYIKTRIAFEIKWWFFTRSATRLIVELPHVKDKLVRLRHFPAERIDIVENCFSSLYLQKNQWIELSSPIESESGEIRIGYISRAYPHKNLDILLPVAEYLKKHSSLKFKFYVTLTDAEWKKFPYAYRLNINNVGPLSVAECPSFYQAMDGIIFSSLLECFSATPLEALVMRKPLFASDRDFVRDICKQHAIYFDPLDAKDIALKILHWFESTPKFTRDEFIENAYCYVLSLSTAKDRAKRYIEIIQRQAHEECK